MIGERPFHERWKGSSTPKLRGCLAHCGADSVLCLVNFTSNAGVILVIVFGHGGVLHSMVLLPRAHLAHVKYYVAPPKPVPYP